MAKITKSIFQRISERWFLLEPTLFAVYCSHQMSPNKALHCVMRTGHGKIEYNPDLVAQLEDEVVEEYLKAEVIRILLKHPYDRLPRDCSPMACTLGSECTLSSYLKWKHISIAQPADFGLPTGEYYEWYARHIQGKDSGSSADSGSSNSSNSSGSSNSSDPTSATAKSEQSALWEEDELMQIAVNDIVENVKSWGSIPGSLVETIIASTKARIDYRKVLSGFRASCISMRRSLTRMRPNRRTGFTNMGSIYRFRTNILVAVDVSSSIASRRLADFYSVINRFFRYGVENIDVMQFDCATGKVASLKKASHKVEIHGRGGTDFQCVIDYANTARCYDGLIIITDGCAPPPSIPQDFRPRLLWICENQQAYDTHHHWMQQTGRVCTINNIS